MENPALTTEEIFETARGIGDPARRAEFLSCACGNDAGLRERVNALLAVKTAADEFFAEPVIKPPPINLPLSEQVGDMIGAYRLMRHVGEGGCGAVYLAEQQQPVQRRVALKIVKLGMDTLEIVARFRNEWQALALMNHPSIARILDAGATASGRPYFVMEYVDGPSLTAYCDNQRLGLSARLELFIEVCAAVQHAHQKGIIHRDLKPSNVLVAVQDGRPVPKVIDFGIAKALDSANLTRTMVTRLGFFLGTPSYMSPEQATRGDVDVDTRSDIYSLGVLLYELLTGVTPYSAQTLLVTGLDEMLRRIRQDDPPRPSAQVRSLEPEKVRSLAAARNLEPGRWSRELRGDLDWIVMKCLEKDRTQRYGSANGLATDLRRYLGSEPVFARPPTLIYQLRKWSRRNRLLAVATTVALVGLLSGGVMLSVALVREQRARGQAMAAESREADLRKEAEGQRDRAARNERDTQVVLNFMLGKLIDAAAPGGFTNSLGPDVSLRATLLAALPEISDAFRNQPLAELELRERLAVTFADLGLFTNAIAQLERAVVLADAHLGRKRVRTIEDLARLGWAYQQLSNDAKHLGYLNQAWQRAVDEFGRTNEAALFWQGCLGVGHREQKRFAEAIQILESAWELSRTTLPPESPVIHDLGNQLAVTYEHAGETERAIPLLEETLQWRKQQSGSESVETTRTMCDLGAAYLRAGRENEGIVYLAEALRLRLMCHGETHVFTIQTHESIAQAFHHKGRWALAAEAWEAVRYLRATKLGPDHYQTRLASQHMAEARAQNAPKP